MNPQTSILVSASFNIGDIKDISLAQRPAQFEAIISIICNRWVPNVPLADGQNSTKSQKDFMLVTPGDLL